MDHGLVLALMNSADREQNIHKAFLCKKDLVSPPTVILEPTWQNNQSVNEGISPAPGNEGISPVPGNELSARNELLEQERIRKTGLVEQTMRMRIIDLTESRLLRLWRA